MSDLIPGKTYIFDRYPFVRTTTTIVDCDGPAEIDCWRPGTVNRLVRPDDAEAVANGLGELRLTVVSVHKPGNFPSRVFCTRQWRDPSGRIFGNGKLHIWTTAKFKRLTARFGYHFVVDPDYREPWGYGHEVNEASASKALGGGE